MVPGILLSIGSPVIITSFNWRGKMRTDVFSGVTSSEHRSSPLAIPIMFFTRLTSWESACKITVRPRKISPLYPLLPSLGLTLALSLSLSLSLSVSHSFSRH